MRAGDTLIYYSPVERRGDRIPLRQFTATGTVSDDLIWHADEGEFKPFRRRIRYEDARPVVVGEVRTALRLTTGPNWGYQLRRGLITLDDDDVGVLRQSMLHR